MEFGLDQVRYFLLREVPFGNDGDFSQKAMINRINSDLANDYGNLAQRVLSMIKKNCGGIVPTPGTFSEDDEILQSASADLLGDLRGKMDVQEFHEGLESIWSVVRAANAYVDAQAPWKLRKEDPARMGTVLYILADTIRRLAFLTQPFMPKASGEILDQLGIPMEERDFAAYDVALVPGGILPSPWGVFPRFQKA